MYALKTVMFTPEVAAAGVGDVNDERLKRSVAQLAGVFELPRQPAPAEVFDRRFLPPLAERKLVLK
jgi:NitT/TauT family transport system substrate-binding protein